MALADSLVVKPRIAEIHAISENLKQSRILCATSVNDLIEAKGAAGMLADWPEARAELLKISAELNSAKWKP